MLLENLRLRVSAVLLVAVFAGGVAIGAVWLGHGAETEVQQVSRSEALLVAHHCWSGDAPRRMRGQLPGHVVVTNRRGRTMYGGTRLVGLALDQQFNHKPAGLTVHGFCR
jgi:hypothetical protein